YAESQNKNNEMRNIVATIFKRMSGSPKPASLEELFDDELADTRRKALAEAEKELADLIGLETVRKKVEELKNFATRLQRQREAGEPPSDRTLHSLLVGNPGTGKTVVARILAKLYFGLGIRRSPEVVEISAADVSSQYLNKGTVNLRKKIQEASGGVLFIDEIYQFSKDSELQKAFENVLMKYMEDHRDDITVLGAGYKEKLSDIFRINPGVESRFYHPDNTIVFPDYSVEELMQIADMMLQKERRTLTTKAREKMFEYIKSREQLGGIGNGRGVRKLIDQILSNADTLCPHGDIDDEAVPDPVKFNEIEARKILGEMNERLMGLDRLKKHLEMLLITQEDKLDRKCFDHSTQHLALLGNPGTGKTTAVEYMARFFHAVGITSRASVVLCDVARDLSNASQVRNKFDEALGGVLFIDEAYRLAKTHAGQQAIHQIVQMMTEKNYRDLVIIIAGYTDKMQKVFNANPGLADRFKEHILFDNFTNQELERIFVNALKRGGFHIPNSEESFQQTLYQEFGKLRNNPRFANARTIEKYFQEVSTRRAARCRNDSNANRFAILTDDLKSSIDVKESLDDILAELDRDFIGLQSVKAQIREMATLLERKIKSKQIAEKQFFNLQFRGNPGTGKTTIARYMARIYNALGLIEGTEIIEQAALTLQGSFLGQTKDGVLKVFEDARTQHKLLFLDEAHALYSPGQIQQDQFSLQVIKTIVSEDTAIYNQKVFTILGGYTDGMKHLMNADVGLSRRFPTIIDFPDYTIDDCLIILDKHLHKNMFQYASSQHEDIKRRLRLIIEDMKKSPHFGNAGAMKNLGEKIIARCKSSDTITLEDLENLSMT
ncbi:MAG: AAA family ATPase, partial [Planctomycetaceae bacterium]|nr:AAA family ATPase [Planctomycetaceae bacterium]